jgi:hypothetical protein
MSRLRDSVTFELLCVTLAVIGYGLLGSVAATLAYYNIAPWTFPVVLVAYIFVTLRVAIWKGWLGLDG